MNLEGKGTYAVIKVIGELPPLFYPIASSRGQYSRVFIP